MRPLFSLRTLAILVALICAYIPLWDAYQSKGTPNAIRILAIIVTLAVCVLWSLGSDKEERSRH
jgi:predicted membrane protein